MLSPPPSNPFLKITENSAERSNLLSIAHTTGSSVKKKNQNKNKTQEGKLYALIADSHYCMAETKAIL